MIQLNTDTIKVKENGQWSNLSSLTGPQGERGATGETGAQGPQGIQGEPGYPTIATGDAGKVLTVNDTETGVEWGEASGGSGGLDIIKEIVLDGTTWTVTQEEYDRIEVGKSAIIEWDYSQTSAYLYVCQYEDDKAVWDDEMHSYVRTHRFVFDSFQPTTSSYDNRIELPNFYVICSYNLKILRKSGAQIQIFDTYEVGQDTNTWVEPQKHNFHPVMRAEKNQWGGIASGYGWERDLEVGDGLVKDGWNLSMQCPIERTENTTPTVVSFDSTNDVMNLNADYNEYYFSNADNSTKLDAFFNYMLTNQPSTVNITMEYTYDNVSYTQTWTSDVTDNGEGAWERFEFSHNISEINRIWYRPSGVASNDGLEVQCQDSSRFVLVSITFNDVIIQVPNGTYTYQTKLPIEAIECDKTVAGTYTLQCTVDAQGNCTYAWV